MTNHPILFPCLSATRIILYAATKAEALKHSLKGHVGQNRYVFRDGVREEFTPLFLIDRTGAYRRVQRNGVRRAWLGFLARTVWDFTLVECEVCEPERLTCGELLDKMQAVKSDRHFPRAGQLKAFLRKLPPQEPFDDSAFRAFWKEHCPAIAEEEWSKQYP
jgi:hypothetical protein